MLKKVMIAPLQTAATIILSRDKGHRRFEIYLLKRHEQSQFMAGNYVYPGGRIDPDDRDLSILQNCRGLPAEEIQKVLGKPSSLEECLAYWIGGIRELFEEAGVLLAYDSLGRPLRIESGLQRKKFTACRDLIRKGHLSLRQFLNEEGVFLALDQLHCYAHWITPEARPHRFDTLFFIARHPAGQEASHDQKETTAGLWASPSEALEKNLAGEIVLSPPTLKTLEDLSRFQTIDEAIRSVEGHSIRPILPVLDTVSGDPVIVFPWDPEYERFQSREVRETPRHGRISCGGDRTTRVIFRDGRWIPYCLT